MEPLPLQDAAADGSLASLDQYKSATPRFDINEPDSKGRTALAHAAWKGHVHVVKLLVSEGADVNKINDKGRTALWYAALSHSSVTKQKRIEVVEHLLDNYAKPNLQALDGTTALMKLIEHREPRVIKLMVKKGASITLKNDKTNMSAADLGNATNDQAVIQALNANSGQPSTRDETVTEAVTYVVKSLGYMNKTLGEFISKIFRITGNIEANLKCTPEYSNSNDSNAETNKYEGLSNRIFGVNTNATTSLGLGDDLDDVYTAALKKDQGDAAVPVSEISIHTTAAAFHASMTKYITETGLSDFFPEGDTFLETVATKAAYLKLDPNNALNSDDDIQDCTKLALYQPVFYCDDSSSMRHGTRVDDQIDLVRRVARISTCLVPDGCGTGLQFINDGRKLNKDLNADQVRDIMQQVKPRGNTKIGTHLEQKILNPLVYDVVNDPTRRLQRPILISCITDGRASGESPNMFRDTILKCVNFLQEKGYPPNTIRFQISQIGNDESAEVFLRQLRDDEQLKNILFCTTQRLDEEYQKLNENEEDLERWLLKTLIGPIIGPLSG